MTDLQLGGAKPLSPFLTIDDDAVYQEASSFSHASGVDGTLIRLYRRGPLVPKSTIPMVVFASLAAVVVLILKCVAASRGGRAPKVVKRSLADSEESSPPGSGVVCGVEEGSSESSSPEQPGSGTEHEEETGEPSSKRQRLDSGPTDGATGGASRSPGETSAAEALLLLMEQLPGPSPSGPGIMPLQQSTEEEQALPAPLLIRESQPITYGLLSPTGESSRDPQPSTSAAAAGSSSPGGDFASSSLPQERQRQRIPAASWDLFPTLYGLLSSTGEPSTDPQPSTSAAAAGSSSPGGDSAGSPHRQSQQQETVESSPAERPKDSQQPLQQTPSPSALEKTAAGVPSGSSASLSSPQPSTSSGLPSQGPGSPQARRVHAFARLPKVQPMERKVVFNPGLLVFKKFVVYDVTPICADMRQWLAQDELSQGLMVKLVRNAEKLVGHCMKYEPTCFSKMNTAETLKTLGRRFLVLDLVVSVFDLLGVPPAGKWWDDLTAAVPHDPPKRRPFKDPQYKFNRELMEELSSALAILKTGVRPSTRKLVQVKRMLFCSNFSPPYFKDRVWDPWRKDDQDARSNNDAED